MNLSLLKPKIEHELAQIGYGLYDIEYVREGKRNILRIFIDHPKGISIDDCETASKRMSDYLDEIDPIESEYYLEVSSPGAERELRTDEDYHRFMGYYVRVETFEQVLEGTLFEVGENRILLQIKGKNLPVERVDIQKIRLAIKF